MNLLAKYNLACWYTSRSYRTSGTVVIGVSLWKSRDSAQAVGSHALSPRIKKLEYEGDDYPDYDPSNTTYYHASDRDILEVSDAKLATVSESRGRIVDFLGQFGLQVVKASARRSGLVPDENQQPRMMLLHACDVALTGTSEEGYY